MVLSFNFCMRQDSIAVAMGKERKGKMERRKRVKN